MTYKQQLENRRLVQQQKEAQQAREMEQQRNKIEDRKKQLQKHLEDNCLDLTVRIHGEEPGKIKLIPPTATDALTIFVEMNGFILQSDTGGRRGTSNWNELDNQIVDFLEKNGVH